MPKYGSTSPEYKWVKRRQNRRLLQPSRLRTLPGSGGTCLWPLPKHPGGRDWQIPVSSRLPGLQSEFPDSQRYTEEPCLNTKQQQQQMLRTQEWESRGRRQVSHTIQKLRHSKCQSGAVGMWKNQDQSPWRLARPSWLCAMHRSTWVEFTVNIL